MHYSFIFAYATDKIIARALLLQILRSARYSVALFECTPRVYFEYTFSIL